MSIILTLQRQIWRYGSLLFSFYPGFSKIPEMKFKFLLRTVIFSFRSTGRNRPHSISAALALHFKVFYLR